MQETKTREGTRRLSILGIGQRWRWATSGRRTVVDYSSAWRRYIAPQFPTDSRRAHSLAAKWVANAAASASQSQWQIVSNPTAATAATTTRRETAANRRSRSTSTTITASIDCRSRSAERQSAIAANAAHSEFVIGAATAAAATKEFTECIQTDGESLRIEDGPASVDFETDHCNLQHWVAQFLENQNYLFATVIVHVNMDGTSHSRTHKHRRSRLRSHSYTCTQNSYYYFQHTHTSTHSQTILFRYYFSFLFSSFSYLCKCLNSFHQDGPRYVSTVLFRSFVRLFWKLKPWNHTHTPH